MQLNDYISAVLEERLSDLHTVALARVISFDNSKMIGSVKPLFVRLIADGQQIPAPVISGVPVAGVKSGGWSVRIPYKAGDVVLIAYCERAIDAAVSGREGVPPHGRKHSIDDAVIIGGLSNDTIAGDGVIIDGPASKIHLKDNGDINIQSNQINVTASGNVSISTPNNIALSSNPGSISITAPVGGVTISGPITTGNF